MVPGAVTMGQLLAAQINPTGELPEPQNPFAAMETLNKRDGFEPTEIDQQIAAAHGTQLAGHFLIDRDGIIRWLQIEAAERIGDLSKFPSDEEIVARGPQPLGDHPMDIAIPLFEGITALDAIGPYEVLSRLPGARVRFVAVTPGPYRTDNRQLTLMADEPLSAVPHPEVLMVPGGFGTRALETPNPLLDWIRAAHETSQWTTSVCTGSMLLAAAGILKGLEATTHWMSLDRLPAYGARPTLKRVVEQGKIITAAGVSSGIDMALTLAARIAGDDVAQAIQLGIEYDPQPPFRAGSPATAPAHIVEGLRARMRARMERDEAAALRPTA